MQHFWITHQTKIDVPHPTRPIQNAIRMLQNDMARSLVRQGEDNEIRLRLDDALSDEAYRIEITPDRITVAYGEDLGAVYGLLSISERFLGVLPFDFWNGREAEANQITHISCGTYESRPQAVRMRGWFINDEVLLDGWKDTQADTLAMWRQIYETLLRCGGNMVIPGTDRKEDGDALNQMALDMGLWLTQHHTELLGARMFARAYPEREASYAKNPQLFEALWQEAIDKYAGSRVIWAVGYRGQGDTAFWTSERGYDTPQVRGEMICSVIARQMELVRAKDPDAVFCTNLYGEMMELYRDGCLPLPEEVIKLWGDNGYGKMVNRRTGNDNPRVPSMPQHEPGRNGLYYHASFYDLQAANHITMSQNAPSLLAGELTRTVESGAADYWSINVGSIKPHIYILDLIRRCWRDGHVEVAVHAEAYAQAYYGDPRVGPLLLAFSEHTMPYGPHPDDRAGDQYYHFVLRHIARALMRGETTAAIPALVWAAGDVPFPQQAAHIEALCAGAVSGWADYLAQCQATQSFLTPGGAQLLEDTLILQATIHLTGCEGLRDTCRVARCLHAGDSVHAYLYAHRALLAHRRGVQALDAAEHDAFVGIYRNDCFSNLRLTVHVLETLRTWIRACYDGEHFYRWERQYLYAPGDRNVWCLTHRRNQLDDETLSAQLMKIVALED